MKTIFLMNRSRMYQNLSKNPTNHAFARQNVYKQNKSNSQQVATDPDSPMTIVWEERERIELNGGSEIQSNSWRNSPNSMKFVNFARNCLSISWRMRSGGAKLQNYDDCSDQSEHFECSDARSASTWYRTVHSEWRSQCWVLQCLALERLATFNLDWMCWHDLAMCTMCMFSTVFRFGMDLDVRRLVWLCSKLKTGDRGCFGVAEQQGT